jgi:hypothetical protein
LRNITYDSSISFFSATPIRDIVSIGESGRKKKVRETFNEHFYYNLNSQTIKFLKYPALTNTNRVVGVVSMRGNTYRLYNITVSLSGYVRR